MENIFGVLLLVAMLLVLGCIAQQLHINRMNRRRREMRLACRESYFKILWDSITDAEEDDVKRIGST